jgi:Txe/YoeB family toxin of Txe-Axe toxin-antitoxin module
MPFETKSGVRQGCLLSPMMLLVVLDKVLRASLDGKARGICWKLTETLEGLDYADDICLLSHSQAHMQSKINNLCYESKKAGLEINFPKTEKLRVNTKSQHSMLANKAIRRVYDFTHLGSNV